MERRLYNRISAQMGVEEKVLIQDGTELIPCTLLNLSGGGALLAFKETAQYFSAGDSFKVFFENGGESLELSSKVVWSRPDKIAFRFCDVSAEQKRAIHTKLIRMGIISARLRSGNLNSHIHPIPAKIEDGQTVSDPPLEVHVEVHAEL